MTVAELKSVLDVSLVWSCRLEELNKYGAFLQTVPKKLAD